MRYDTEVRNLCVCYCSSLEIYTQRRVWRSRQKVKLIIGVLSDVLSYLVVLILEVIRRRSKYFLKQPISSGANAVGAKLSKPINQGVHHICRDILNLLVIFFDHWVPSPPSRVRVAFLPFLPVRHGYLGFFGFILGSWLIVSKNFRCTCRVVGGLSQNPYGIPRGVLDYCINE